MPLIQIHLVKGKSKEYLKAVSDGIHLALQNAWQIPENDRFQMINEYEKENFHFDKTIWGVSRSDDLICIYITSAPRSVEMKQSLYKEIANVLEKKPKVRKEDVFICIVPIDKENWSFGNGVAQFLDPSLRP